MANLRALDKRRKSIKKHPQDHADHGVDRNGAIQEGDGSCRRAATDYTERITAIVRDLAKSGASVSHPLLEGRDAPRVLIYWC